MPAGILGSTSQLPSGRAVEKWIVRSGPAGTAAGSVRELLTTSRSPATEQAGQIGEPVVGDRPAGRSGLVLAADHHPHAIARQAARLGRGVRLEVGREGEFSDGSHRDAFFLACR